jgi:hypothetical protein
MVSNSEFGKRVKRQREQELGVGRKALAEWTGIGLWWLERIEGGQLDESALTADEVARLADVLHCTPDWLISGSQGQSNSLGLGVVANRSRKRGLRQQELPLTEPGCPNCQRPVSGAKCQGCGHPYV